MADIGIGDLVTARVLGETDAGTLDRLDTWLATLPNTSSPSIHPAWAGRRELEGSGLVVGRVWGRELFPIPLRTVFSLRFHPKQRTVAIRARPTFSVVATLCTFFLLVLAALVDALARGETGSLGLLIVVSVFMLVMPALAATTLFAARCMRDFMRLAHELERSGVRLKKSRLSK